MKRTTRTHLLVAAMAMLSAGLLNAADVTGDRLNVGIAHGLSGTAAASSIAGGENNTIGNTTLFSLIGGGLDNVIGTNCWSAGILAGDGNTIANNVQYAFIGAGYGNVLSADYSTILGLNINITANAFASFGNGYFNDIDGPYGTILNGVNNIVAAEGGLILNGLVHTISTNADYALIGNGQWHLISRDAEYSAIVGGISNAVGIHAEYSYIGNGEVNTNNSSWAYLGGGYRNLILSNANYSVISGGLSNRVSGSRGAIPGGESNTVSADYAFAAGRHAHAAHQGAFVWSDSTGTTFASTNNNEFAARAHGGVRFQTGAGTGVKLSPGSGSWASLSDRNAKTHFASVNTREILGRVATLPLSTWSYKAQDKSVRHIGPVAQDFRAAFDVGEDERTITTVDADGVALAAIQALNDIVKEKDAAISQLSTRLKTLEDLMLKQQANK
jgi:trimeric autotransporter adhesin